MLKKKNSLKHPPYDELYCCLFHDTSIYCVIAKNLPKLLCVYVYDKRLLKLRATICDLKFGFDNKAKSLFSDEY